MQHVEITLMDLPSPMEQQLASRGEKTSRLGMGSGSGKEMAVEFVVRLRDSQQTSNQSIDSHLRMQSNRQTSRKQCMDSHLREETKVAQDSRLQSTRGR